MEAKTVNKVILNNVKVVAITTKRNSSIITVAVPVPRTANRRPIYLKVTVRNNVTLPEKLNITNYIDVSGFIRAYYLRPETKDGQWKRYQYIVADSISKSKTILEKDYGITAGKLYGVSEAVALLSGRVTSCSESNGWQKATVVVDFDNDGRKSSYVRINYKIRGNKRIEKDDIISTTCSIYSDRKNIGGTLKDFEDIVVRDFSVIGHRTSENTKQEEEMQEEEQPVLEEA